MVASVKRLRVAPATVEYFEADGYYAPGDPEHRRASRWYGAVAKLCGLANHTVTARAFASVLEGYVPGTDTRLGRLRDGEHQHLPGIDVTFSAPKSVSLEALLHAPGRTRARLLNAHDAAVRAALDFLERELLQTRGYDRATRRRPRIAAHGLLAATFRHLTSRNLDPQLHTTWPMTWRPISRAMIPAFAQLQFPSVQPRPERNWSLTRMYRSPSQIRALAFRTWSDSRISKLVPDRPAAPSTACSADSAVADSWDGGQARPETGSSTASTMPGQRGTVPQAPPRPAGASPAARAVGRTGVRWVPALSQRPAGPATGGADRTVVSPAAVGG